MIDKCFFASQLRVNFKDIASRDYVQETANFPPSRGRKSLHLVELLLLVVLVAIVLRIVIYGGGTRKHVCFNHHYK
jgi:hypothetical protein